MILINSKNVPINKDFSEMKASDWGDVSKIKTNDGIYNVRLIEGGRVNLSYEGTYEVSSSALEISSHAEFIKMSEWEKLINSNIEQHARAVPSLKRGNLSIQENEKPNHRSYQLPTELISREVKSDQQDSKQVMINKAHPGETEPMDSNFYNEVQGKKEDLIEIQNNEITYQTVVDKPQETSASQEKTELDHIVSIQKYIRQYGVIGQKAHKDANVLCLYNPGETDPDEKIVGYRMLPGSINGTEGKYPYVAIPAEVPVDEDDESLKGAHKKLTHRDSKFVVLTSYSSFPENNIQAVIDVIEKNNFKCLVPQPRINDTQYMALNLGKHDLFTMGIENNHYQFDCAHVVPLAEELDAFHKEGFAHCDIKPENMFFDHDTNKMYLTDFDFAGKIAEFHEISGTRDYMPNEYMTRSRSGKITGFKEIAALARDDEEKRKIIAKQDIFALFVTIIILINNDALEKINKRSERKQYVLPFVRSLPCSDKKRINLANFILNPIKNNLDFPLEEYFLAED
jgi:hypothetical protein